MGNAHARLVPNVGGHMLPARIGYVTTSCHGVENYPCQVTNNVSRPAYLFAACSTAAQPQPINGFLQAGLSANIRRGSPCHLTLASRQTKHSHASHGIHPAIDRLSGQPPCLQGTSNLFQLTKSAPQAHCARTRCGVCTRTYMGSVRLCFPTLLETARQPVDLIKTKSHLECRSYHIL